MSPANTTNGILVATGCSLKDVASAVYTAVITPSAIAASLSKKLVFVATAFACS